MAEPASVSQGAEQVPDSIDVIEYTPGGAPPSKPKKFTPLRLFVFILLFASAVALWFVFTAKSVWVQIDPTPDTVELQGGWPRISYKDHYLMRRGDLQINATKEGYVPLDTVVTVERESSQRFQFQLEKLPGYLRVNLPAGLEGTASITTGA